MATVLQEQSNKDNDQESSDLPLTVMIRGDLKLIARLRVELPPASAPTAELHAPIEEEEEEEAPKEEAPKLFPKSPTSPLKRRAPVSGKDVEFSALSALAEKRKLRAKDRGLASKLKTERFQDSSIIETSEERTMLYLCCPFKGQPLTRLLFSTARDGWSTATMHEKIDNIGITIVLVQRGPFKFGGFAAAKWQRNGKPFGKAGSSFLFSITRDAHVPYKRDGAGCPLLATDETLTFGEYDLVLGKNFERCSSVIEHNYGLGFDPNSQEAEEFLAGRSVFRPDVVEVWGFFIVDE
jgi:hypothetical protein